jgi:hypothetical protein
MVGTDAVKVALGGEPAEDTETNDSQTPTDDTESSPEQSELAESAEIDPDTEEPRAQD